MKKKGKKKAKKGKRKDGGKGTNSTHHFKCSDTDV